MAALGLDVASVGLDLRGARNQVAAHAGMSVEKPRPESLGDPRLDCERGLDAGGRVEVLDEHRHPAPEPSGEREGGEGLDLSHGELRAVLPIELQPLSEGPEQVVTRPRDLLAAYQSGVTVDEAGRDEPASAAHLPISRQHREVAIDAHGGDGPPVHYHRHAGADAAVGAEQAAIFEQQAAFHGDRA